MEAAEGLQFGPYRLASAQGPLWKAGAVVALQPRAMAVLWLLATRVGEVVTKDALFAAIWEQTIVSEGALTVCIRQIRQALGDTAATSQYITTVHRIGYRFIAPVTAGAATIPRSTVPVAREDTPTSVLHPQPSILVGRDPELTQLHELCKR